MWREGKLSEGNDNRLNDPALWAAAEQATMKMRDLTNSLMRLHGQALTEMCKDSPDDKVLSRLRFEMMVGLHDALMAQENPDAVFQYVMFLVNEVYLHHKRDLTMGARLNDASFAINEIASLLGMVPLIGGVRDDSPLRPGQFRTGRGQVLDNVHSADVCQGWCVIHKPIPGPWDDWDTNWRGDGLFDIWRGFERFCPHGVGHPAMEEILRGNIHAHGCCDMCPCGPPAAVEIRDEDGQLKGYR